MTSRTPMDRPSAQEIFQVATALRQSAEPFPAIIVCPECGAPILGDEFEPGKVKLRSACPDCGYGADKT